jgi:hypothetical protein
MQFRKINVVSSENNMEHTHTLQRLLNVKADGKYINQSASKG